jgi:hypothetical protein
MGLATRPEFRRALRVTAAIVLVAIVYGRAVAAQR